MVNAIQNGMNLNDRVWVRLTDAGWEMFRRHYADLGLDPAPYVDLLLGKAADGWLPFQMWDVMQVFGPSVGIGVAVPFEGNVIRFDPEPSR